MDGRGRPRRSAVLARDRQGAGHPVHQEGLELDPASALERLQREVQALADLAQHVDHRVLVAADDLAVEHRVSPGDAGHVAHALPGEREVLRRRAGQRTGDERGEQVRHVRRPGDGAVVLGRAQPHRHRAADLHQALDSALGIGGGVTAWTDRPRAAVEQAGRRGQRPRALAAGHRVAADVAAQPGVSRHGLERRGLHAADVGDHGLRPGRVERGADRLAQVVRRHGDDHQPGLVALGAGAARAQPGRGAHVAVLGVGEQHLDAGTAAGERDRRTDQAGADDLDRLDALLSHGRQASGAGSQAPGW